MCDPFEKIKDLNLSRDEVNKIGEALKKDEFRQLFHDYINEIQDPDNRRIYEQEIIELEKQRGIDVRFIKPSPGYVIKTSINGNQKCFINICMNDTIDKPTSIPEIKNGHRGLQWSLPHSITPPRDDYDNKKIRCRVVDVIFHSNTLYLAKKNKDFYQMVNNTAIDTIEKNFDVELDRKNVKYPKLQYKGMPQSAMIKTQSFEHKPIERQGVEKELFDKIYKEVDELSTKNHPKTHMKKTNRCSNGKYTIPKYSIKYRNHIEFDEFVEHKHAKLYTTIPKELLIEIDLPLLKASGDITLDVNEKTLELISEQPSKYKLNLTLPYRVNQDNGNAKFDKDLRKLLVLLPVKRQTNIIDINHDSGIDSDYNQQLTPEISNISHNNNDNVAVVENSFLDSDIDYLLPEFNCHYFESTIAFTLNVKNVDKKSLDKLIECDSIHIKFLSIGSSFYPINYSIYIKLPIKMLQNEVLIEVWDNNVIVQIPLDNDCQTQLLQYYYYGLDVDHLQQKYLDEPSIINRVYENTIIEEPDEFDDSSPPPPAQTVTKTANERGKKSEAINIFGTSYESSGDELSCCSYSPSKSKGILKNRRFVGRSISESSLDDYVYCSSVDNEISASLKKTVRFNDVIMRQLYRSNSSILGQKKKNQRKARNKKRALERRYSESEASEIDDQHSTTTTDTGNVVKAVDDDGTDGISFISNDIFQMEIGC